MELSSLNNEKVKFWQKLKLKKYRDTAKLFLVEDDHLVREAINKKIVKEIITVDKDLTFDYPTYYVTPSIMKSLSEQVTGAKTIAVCHFLDTKEIDGNILVVDKLQDPGNLGTIIRSAVAFNFKTLILSDDSVDLYNPKVIRASEGMFFHLNIIRTNIVTFLQNLDNSYKKIGTIVKDGKKISDIKYQNIALIIGNEGKGVSQEVLQLCDDYITIEMNKSCESLNAAVSASILMYEVNNG